MISESIACKEAALSGRLALINSGTTHAAAIRIYDGTRPASPEVAAAGNMLAQVDLANPAGAIAGGLLTLTPAGYSMITTTGAPTWARVVNRDGATVFDMSAGQAGSGPGGTDPDCLLSDPILYAGGSVVILSAVFG